MQRWRQAESRPYNWAAKGRSADMAVWEASVRSGAAKVRQQSAASTLLDLRKAYELVRLELVWKAAVKISPPPSSCFDWNSRPTRRLGTYKMTGFCLECARPTPLS